MFNERKNIYFDPGIRRILYELTHHVIGGKLKPDNLISVITGLQEVCFIIIMFIFQGVYTD